MSDVMLYGVRRVVLTELNADGTVKDEGLTCTIDTPQEVSFEPEITEGVKNEHRGGDALIGSVRETDKLTGVTATFRDALLDYKALKMIAGGKVRGITPDYTGWDAPTLSEQAGTPSSPLKVEVFCSRYPVGAQMEGAVAGYTRVILWYAKGTIPSFTMTDRGFVVPSYTLRSGENAALGKGPMSVDDVESI